VARDTAEAGLVLVIAADRREFSGILRLAENTVPLQWPVDWCSTATLAGRHLVLVANGPGELLAAEAFDVALRETRSVAVVNTGFCGALSPEMRPGYIVVASRVEPLERTGGLPCMLPETTLDHRTGTLLTSNRVILTAAEKNELRKRGGDAVDMEAAAVGERSASRGLPFYSIRAVTDLANEDLRVDLNAARGPDGRFSDWRIVTSALTRPWPCLPELWKLRRRSALATDRLGQFLAGCRFPTVADPPVTPLLEGSGNGSKET
jgi:nucleoside phosphorylase